MENLTTLITREILSLDSRCRRNVRVFRMMCLLLLLPGAIKRNMTGATEIWPCASKKISPSSRIIRRPKLSKLDRSCELQIPKAEKLWGFLSKGSKRLQWLKKCQTE